MQQTGMTRRIDELGRIVIPKEIRKSLKISDGETLEVLLNDNQIVLQKHDVIKKEVYYLNLLIKAITEIFDVNIFVTNQYEIIATNSKINGLNNKEISKYLLELLKERKKYSNNFSEIIKITYEDNLEGYFNIKPIIVDNDLFGLICLNSNTKNDINELLVNVIVTIFNYQFFIN